MGRRNTLRVDASGDLFITDDDQPDTPKFLVGSEALQQSLQLRLATFLGEDILDPHYGLPVRQIIQSGSMELLESFLNVELLKDKDVQSILSIKTSLDRSLGVMAVLIEAQTVLGVIRLRTNIRT